MSGKGLLNVSCFLHNDVLKCLVMSTGLMFTVKMSKEKTEHVGTRYNNCVFSRTL